MATLRLGRHLRMGRHLREKLIEEVQRCPILYDTKHLQHRDADMRDRAWNDIAERLGEHTETLKREWKILRDSLRQALRKYKQRGGRDAGAGSGGSGGGSGGKPWYFEDKMAFLKPYMTARPSYKYSSKSYSELKVDSSAADEYFEPEAAEVEAVEAQASRDAFWEAGDGDGLELFFASACAAARRLPRRLHGQLKRQVLDALLRAEEEAERSESKEDVGVNY